MAFPIIPVAIAAMQIGKGIAEGAKGKRLTKDAAYQNSMIPARDPGVTGLLEDIDIRRRYAETGQTRMMAVKQRLIKDNLNSANRSAERTAGTSPGIVQQSLQRNQILADKAAMEGAAFTENQGLQLLNMSTPLIMDQADRDLSQRQYGRDLAGFQGAQAGVNSNNAWAGGIGLLSGLTPNATAGGADKSMDVSAVASPGATPQMPYAPTSVPGLNPNTTMPAAGNQFGLGPNGSSYGADLLKPKGGFALPYSTPSAY